MLRELAVASLIETLSTFAHQKFSRYPALVMSVHLNGSSELRPSRKSSGKGFLPEEFMSPAVPIDFISHELSLLSVYLGISLINLSFSLPLYILIIIQYYYTRFGIAVKSFLRNEGQQGVQRVAVSSVIYSMCVGDSFR